MPDTAIPVDVGELFEKLKAEWKSKTRYMSNSAQMATVWPYQQIIGLGRPALVLILKELERETDHWFWALEAISGENPVPAERAGDVESMAKSWIEWGRQKGIT
ncbi:MAG: hypothetical protein HQ581_26605 [Planctomycetes bacterium]|nr:hypothetical protein [Planctomycetota bacterium]